MTSYMTHVLCYSMRGRKIESVGVPRHHADLQALSHPRSNPRQNEKSIEAPRTQKNARRDIESFGRLCIAKRGRH